MVSLADAVVGAVVAELLKVILEQKKKASKFNPTLERLENTLKSLGPFIDQIGELNTELDRSRMETERLVNDMNRGTELVLKCSKVHRWDCYHKAKYQEKLEALNDSIRWFFQIDMIAHITRNGLENMVNLQELRDEVRDGFFRNQRIELREVCTPPKPPSFIIGFDVHLNELKHKLLYDSVSVFTITGSGGSGKSTLAKMICQDDQVRGTFKKNIFFITFGKTPKLKTIVQKMYQHTGYHDTFQSEEDVVNQLEHLLRQNEENPKLFVLDDVWPKSEPLIDIFLPEIRNHKILVTSRSAIKRFGDPFVLNPLGEVDAINLFRHSASLDQSSSEITDDDVEKIVKSCCGSPLALTVTGRSLCKQHAVFWHERVRELSTGHSILDTNSDILDCLQKSLDFLDPMSKECFRDLGLFPEGQRISAAVLVDMLTELHNEDDVQAMVKIYKLVNLNMADIFVTRKIVSSTVEYKYHYITQHSLLRELAIRQTDQEPVEKTNRLIIDISGNNVPAWWTHKKENHIAARLLSISTDSFLFCLGAHTSKWCNLQVLVLNLREKKCTLPKLIKKMNKLKVLIITNYDFCLAELENFELLDHLSDLKRIRLEKVSIPLLSKTPVQLKNLHKLSLYMCNVNESFKNCSMPNLVEMNIDYCSMVELPVVLSNIISLKKLSITNCHKLSVVPEGIGELVNLESLSLSSCTILEDLPDSITSLRSLKFLDISDCININKLPDDMGNLGNLEKLIVRGCSKLSDSQLPSSIKELGSLREVVCDEEMAALWEPFETILNGLEIKQAEFNLVFLPHLR